MQADCVVNPNRSIRISFVLASGGSVGGAERSMLRLIQATHPSLLECSVILNGVPDIPVLQNALADIGNVPCCAVAPWDFWRGVRFLRRWQPDLLYTFGLKRGLWALVARLAGVRAAIGAERGSMPRFIDILVRRIDKHVLKAYIANSQKASDILVHKVGVSPNKIYVVYNGLEEPNMAQPVEPKPPEWGDPTLICVANIRRRKGHIYLLQAIKQLRHDFPHLKVVLVGWDYTKGQVFADLKSQGLEDTYEWLGFVEDIYNCVRRADIFVLPAISREGMPTSVLEAMAVGLPVVATDVGGTAELVQDGKTGLVIPPRDTQALVEAIGRLLRSPALRQQLGSNARQYVLQFHTVENMVQGHLKALHHIASQNRLEVARDWSSR